VDADANANTAGWKSALAEAGLDIDVVSCGAVLALIDELREATALQAQLSHRIDGSRGTHSSILVLSSGL
jgi:hypothetical protein